jgi:hypothetical protein
MAAELAASPSLVEESADAGQAAIDESRCSKRLAWGCPPAVGRPNRAPLGEASTTTIESCGSKESNPSGGSAGTGAAASGVTAATTG